MVTATNTFNRLIKTSGRKLFGEADILLTDLQRIQIKSQNIVQGGLSIKEGTSGADSFDIGSTVMGELALNLDNSKRQFENYDFTGAVITPKVGLLTQQKWDGTKTIEYINMGTFIVDEAPKSDSMVRITALDNMSKFEQAYSKSALVYPATLGQIVADACTVCGVILATPTFTNSNYVVTTRPTDTAMTFREVVGYAAALGGNFAKCNRNGALEIGWYDFSKAHAEIAGIKSTDVATADIVVTGVQIVPNEDKGTTYISGKEGYVVKIENNPLAQDNLQSLVDSIGVKLNGFTFRPYTVTGLSNPAIEAGDVVTVTDRFGNQHESLISNISYSIDNVETFTADAETQAKNQSVRFTAAGKAQVAAYTAQKTADRANKGVEEAKAEITTLNGEIVLKASKANLISEINVCPEQITIDTKKLNITGLVTIQNLENGSTTVNGACIQTGRIVANNSDFYIDVDTGEVYMKNGTFAGQIVWGSNNYIKQTSTGTTEIKASSAIKLVADGTVEVVGPFEAIDGFFTGDVTCDRVIPSDGITKDLLVFESESNDRYLEIEHGIITGWHDS